MKQKRIARIGTALLAFLIAIPPGFARAEGSDDAKTVKQVQRELVKLRQERERDLKLIEDLEKKVDAIQSQSHQLQQTTTQLQQNNTELKSYTDTQITQLKTQVSDTNSPQKFSDLVNGYLGTHQFTLTGAVAGSFIYDRKANVNTFAFDWEPIILWKVNDWLAFEGTIEANLPAGSDAEFQMPVAVAQIFLNDYLELYAGIFDNPFGDFYEDQSAFWVNRFISAPLPYGTDAIVPPGDVGLQLRGGLQWGQLGQDLDYTAWISNGPAYADQPAAIIGDPFNDVNNISTNTNGRTFGARFRIYPFPLDSQLGRLELGASTEDGKWQNGLWYNAWGVDFNYNRNNLQARGEFIQSYRQMPAGVGPDNRQGWYVQAGYFLNGIGEGILPSELQNYVNRLEVLCRYSGVNQRAIVDSAISTVPELGFNGSPAAFSPHAREVAFGLDYYIAPSIIWQNEIDLELPNKGGYLYKTATGTYAPFGTPINDQAFMTQFTIGF